MPRRLLVQNPRPQQRAGLFWFPFWCPSCPIEVRANVMVNRLRSSSLPIIRPPRGPTTSKPSPPNFLDPFPLCAFTICVGVTRICMIVPFAQASSGVSTYPVRLYPKYSDPPPVFRFLSGMLDEWAHFCPSRGHHFRRRRNSLFPFSPRPFLCPPRIVSFFFLLDPLLFHHSCAHGWFFCC